MGPVLSLIILSSVAFLRVITSIEKHSKPLNLPIPFYFQNWRNTFLEISAPYDPSGLLRGMFLGHANSVPNLIIQDFRRMGLTHLIAASGFNCWIVGILFVVLGRLLLPRDLVSKGDEAFVFLIGTILFWLWTDQNPPVTRAFLMASFSYYLRKKCIYISFRRHLFLQYIGGVIVFPSLWTRASYQLSYGCLFGLVVAQSLQKTLNQKIPKNRKWLRGIVTYITTNLGACLGASPALWFFFGELNMNSLWINFLAVPPVSFFIMPLGLLEMLLIPFIHLSPVFLKACIQNMAQINGSFCVHYAQVLHFISERVHQNFPYLYYAPYRDFP